MFSQQAAWVIFFFWSLHLPTVPNRARAGSCGDQIVFMYFYIVVAGKLIDLTLNNFNFIALHICYLLAGRSVLGKTVPEVLSTGRGRL